MSVRRRIRRWFCHRIMRLITLLYCIALIVAECIGGSQRKQRKEAGGKILITGRFDSDNWILAHLGPLSASKRCAHLRTVSTDLVPAMPRVVGTYPPRWLVKLAGATPARLLTFTWTAIRTRPDIVGGFHIMANGMAATAVGRLVGARTLYFCVGGVAEILDGGVWGEGSYCAEMETPDPVVEDRLIRAVSACDKVITMGTGAADFFRSKGVDTEFHVVSGGIDADQFWPSDERPLIDVILVGRLVAIKRIDVLLEAIRHVRRSVSDVRVAVVGDGELRETLAQRARDLGVSDCLEFAGHQRNVGDWLRRSKIFVLTSDSEGLALSVMEAMMCGLPAVVSNVGDLGDLVEDGVNGYLVPRRSPKVFAERIVDLLQDEQKLAAFSRAARRSAIRYDVATVTRQWDEILVDGRPS